MCWTLAPPNVSSWARSSQAQGSPSPAAHVCRPRIFTPRSELLGKSPAKDFQCSFCILFKTSKYHYPLYKAILTWDELVRSKSTPVAMKFEYPSPGTVPTTFALEDCNDLEFQNASNTLSENQPITTSANSSKANQFGHF